MNVVDVIRNLNSATQGSRVFDGQIAILLGWVRRTKSVVDGHTGETKVTEQWFFKDSSEAGRVPFYTSNLGCALQLAQELCPQSRLGCAWEEGKGSARIDSDRYIQAASPQIALCIAALMAAARGGYFSEPAL
ncbi:hypothetical protein GGE35_005296 [Rhizobium cellulosilyticum]|uniref:DUF2591 domain-containing protein n=1 Tax=Aliirhizobium cellulosilyticum TaxID=393664 RepID=A0A7W6WPU7_9HYPH|nr:hypothetical protein [Rhizobium cellulosilyticum]MBB4411958.1 hypothetical protein [Rhizobium cellulosilyticum]MBB4449442.1 hypothetical protein [Rhizobium cellulosilyticum]